MIKRIIKYMNKKRLEMYKEVKLDKKVSYTIDSNFEGNNRVNKNSIISNSSIGFATYIGENSIFINTKIGRYCSIANNVKTVVATHPTNTFISTHPAFFSTKKQAGFTYVAHNKFEEIKYIEKEKNISVVIGNDVWIGENVVILGGVKIGDGAIIGANSIVTKNIEPYSINVGNPAKKIKYRFSRENIELLEKIKWWDRSQDWIIKNAELFDNINNIKKMEIEDE